MSETKHTPGPWKFDDMMYVFGPKNEMVCQIRGYGAGLPQEANARLIVSAPELLEACKAALVALRECNEPEAKIVAEAISKAEGRAV